MECLDEDDVACCDENFVTYLDEGVVKFLDNIFKEYFDVDFLFAHSLEYILEETLYGKCLVYHGYMKKIGWSENYVFFCYYNKYKNMMI